jgi:hypothetical protein
MIVSGPSVILSEAQNLCIPVIEALKWKEDKYGDSALCAE